MTDPSTDASGTHSDIICHFTATGLVLHAGRVLLVEHRKSGLFLGPGGHVEHEDPAHAVLREIREEVGIDAEIIDETRFSHPAVSVVPPPFTVLVVDRVNDPVDDAQRHVDLIYVCRPMTHDITIHADEIDGYRWAATVTSSFGGGRLAPSTG